MLELKLGAYTLYEFLDLHEAIIDLKIEEERRAAELEDK